MVTYFNKKDIISFGKYLLSEERERRVRENPIPVHYDDRFREVTHADITNWKETL